MQLALLYGTSRVIHSFIRSFIYSFSPEEVLPAVDLAFPEEALLRQVGLAVAALHALGVPLPVEEVEQEAVQDGPLAAGTLRHGRGGYSGDPLTPVMAQPGGQGVQGSHLVGRQVHGVRWAASSRDDHAEGSDEERCGRPGEGERYFSGAAMVVALMRKVLLLSLIHI